MARIFIALRGDYGVVGGGGGLWSSSGEGGSNFFFSVAPYAVNGVNGINDNNNGALDNGDQRRMDTRLLAIL